MILKQTRKEKLAKEAIMNALHAHAKKGPMYLGHLTNVIRAVLPDFKPRQIGYDNLRSLVASMPASVKVVVKVTGGCEQIYLLAA